MQLQGVSQASQQLRVAQIITAAMIGGIVLFLGVALLQGKQVQKADPDPTMAYIAAGFAIFAVLMRNILPTVIMKNYRRQLSNQKDKTTEDSDALATRYLTMTIIKNAMLEAPAFVVLVIYFIVPYPALPMIAVSILLIMAFSFPNQNRFNDFIRTQTELIELDQHN